MCRSTEALTTGGNFFFNILATLPNSSPLQWDQFEVSTLRTVNTTISFMKNVNPISHQVQNMQCHSLSHLEGKNSSWGLMVIKLWILQVCSTGVASLKTVVYLCMMINWLKKLWNKSKMHSVMIADWLWMNFLWCFCKFPDLCYTKPSQKPSDIGNCLRGGPKTADRSI